MKGPHSFSLRGRLVKLLTGVLAVVWLFAVLVVYQRTHHEADELLDSQLTQVAGTLLAIMAGGEVEHFVNELHEHADHCPVPIVFEIWRLDHGVMRRLATSPGHDAFEADMIDGFSEHLHQGNRWRFYAEQDEDAEYRVVAGQSHAARERLAREIGLSMLLPALLALPLMALAVWWGVGRGLEPVNTVARQIGRLDAQALVPLDESVALPNEIAPLRNAFNVLIRRVSDAFDNERRFTADAAHELRTPLAALKIQAQVAQRAQTPDSQQHALAQVVAGVDRMTHLVEQLLTLARVDPTKSLEPMPSFDPAAQLREMCAGFSASALPKGQHLAVDIASGCCLALPPAWLDIAARNLIDNALRYAGDAARIEVRFAREGDCCVFSVADSGEGISQDLRARLTGRFTRGETEAEGCGLGLSIVARIAALSHAQLEFGDGLPRAGGGHGFAARLRFNAVADAA
ncbi:MAG: ATP-binding protein [Thiobacillus sp.]